MLKRIKKLTKKQKAMLPIWRDKWIAIGLKTGETDWDTFDTYMPICYEKAGLKYPKKVIRVASPLVGALAASIAASITDGKDKRTAVDTAVATAVATVVGTAVNTVVGTAVDTVAYTGVGNAKLIEWHNWLGGQFWVGGWWYGPAYISFFREVCKLKLSKDIEERADAYQKICESVNYIWPNKNFVMVCARPIKINRNAQGRLHSDTEKAIEYPDGWGLYLLNGVLFPEDLWQKVVSKTMPFEEILAIRDIDQRTQAMRYGDIQKFFEHTKSELLEKSEITKNELWRVPQSAGIFTQDAYFLRYWCSSTNREYMSGVDPEIGKKNDSDEAMSWKHWLDKDSYLEMVKNKQEA